MERIGQISSSLTKGNSQDTPKVVENSLTWMGFDQLLPESSRELGRKLRPLLESDAVYKRLIDYAEQAQFPEDLVPIVRKLDIAKYFYKADSTNPWDKVAIMLELGRIDASLTTFFLVQNCLLGKTIELYGSEEQKKEYLPKIKNFDIIGGWGLTEVDIGSDASSIQTTAKLVGNEYILNGNKRWIGNANKDILTVFAKEVSSGEVQCFIVDLKSPGVSRSYIKYKMALRPVQNGEIHFKDVRIPIKNKLPGVKGFQSVAALLAESRIFVAWLAAAQGLGLYDYMMRYLKKRQQFEKPILAFQLMQEKVFKVMSRVQSNLFFCYNIHKLHVEGKATFGQIAMLKGHTTEMLREAARFGREALGGNGIVLDNHVMKVLCDAEALFTYEGTYDINLLVAGRELTGIAAFKTR